MKPFVARQSLAPRIHPLHASYARFSSTSTASRGSRVVNVRPAPSQSTLHAQEPTKRLAFPASAVHAGLSARSCASQRKFSCSSATSYSRAFRPMIGKRRSGSSNAAYAGSPCVLYESTRSSTAGDSARAAAAASASAAARSALSG